MAKSGEAPKAIADIERNGKCLRCGKPMVKNHLSCLSCRKKIRLMAKANRRGKHKYYYINQ